MRTTIIVNPSTTVTAVSTPNPSAVAIPIMQTMGYILPRVRQAQQTPIHDAPMPLPRLKPTEASTMAEAGLIPASVELLELLGASGRSKHIGASLLAHPLADSLPRHSTVAVLARAVEARESHDSSVEKFELREIRSLTEKPIVRNGHLHPSQSTRAFEPAGSCPWSARALDHAASIQPR